MAETAHALYRDALAACEQGRVEEGVAILERARVLSPDQPRIYGLLGQALIHLSRHEEALANFDRALALGASSASLHGNRADALAALGRREEAVQAYDRALAIKPDSVNEWCNRGAVLCDLKQYEAALASFDRVTMLVPDFAPAHYNRGNAYAGLGQHEQAIASYDQAIKLAPDHADSHNNRGQSLRAVQRAEQALESFERALVAVPDHCPALINRAGILCEMRRYEQALRATERALASFPDSASAWQIRGQALLTLGRLQDAIASYERASQLGLMSATPMLGYCSLMACDWPHAERAAAELAAVIEKRSVVAPFALIAFGLSPDLQRKSVETFVQSELSTVTQLPASPRRDPGGRIRLGYVSSDFGIHAVTALVVALLEHHDRARFDVVGISVGPQRDDAMRHRVAAACSEFHEFGSLADADAASRIRDLRIDIAVDLTGYTENARPGILGRRPAPVQVSYLGYLGTMGAPFIDYIIADAVVLPFSQQPHYAEKIVHLPDCFFPNDRALEISKIPSRSEVGLPQDAIVLCSFNNSYKFRAPIFEVWMRLLRNFSNSILWLVASNDQLADNLRREARDRGVDPARLVFAPRKALPDHLARQTLADLFLDTFPYNAGATAANTLWAGVPVLTVMGETLVGRMAASMLYAVGLPELVAANLADYEARAQILLGDRRRLAEVRSKLASNRLTHPLFDTDRSRRHIEAAYETMWESFIRGEPPRAFVVSPIEMA